MELPAVTQLIVQLKGDADRLSATKASLESEVFALKERRDSLLVEVAVSKDREFRNERQRLKDWEERLSKISDSLKSEQESNREENDRIERETQRMILERESFVKEKAAFLADSEVLATSVARNRLESLKTARDNGMASELLSEAEAKSRIVENRRKELEKDLENFRKDRESFENFRKLSVASFEEREKSLQSESKRIMSEWAALKSAKAHIDNLKS